MSVTPAAIRQLLDELEANRRSRRIARAMLQRLRKFLEANGARISVPDDRNFESEGEAIESGLRRTTRGATPLCAALFERLSDSETPLWLPRRRMTLAMRFRTCTGNWSGQKIWLGLANDAISPLFSSEVGVTIRTAKRLGIIGGCWYGVPSTAQLRNSG